MEKLYKLEIEVTKEQKDYMRKLANENGSTLNAYILQKFYYEPKAFEQVQGYGRY